MNYLIGGAMATIISTNLLNNIITSVINTLYETTLFIRKGSCNNAVIEKYKKEIEEMDIAVKLQIIQNKLFSNGNLEKNETLKILGLLELMFKIKSVIDSINYEIDKHNNKWFASYRYVNINSKIAELRHLIKILDCRIQLYTLSNM